MSLFPAHWGYRRIAEIEVAIYATLLGAALFLDPMLLEWPGYEALGGPPAAKPFGLLMMLVAAVQSWALWLNGRNPRWSRRCRIFACASHGTIVIYLIWVFAVNGARWHAILMLWVLAHIYFAFTRACNPGVESEPPNGPL